MPLLKEPLTEVSPAVQAQDKEIENLIGQYAALAKGAKKKLYLEKGENLVKYYAKRGYNTDTLLRSFKPQDKKAVKELTKMTGALKGKYKGISADLKKSLEHLFNKANK